MREPEGQVDEIVRYEKDGKGTMFVFQDANWNVTATVSYDAVPLDRIHTKPYGQPTRHASCEASSVSWHSWFVSVTAVVRRCPPTPAGDAALLSIP